MDKHTVAGSYNEICTAIKYSADISAIMINLKNTILSEKHRRKVYMGADFITLSVKRSPRVTESRQFVIRS